MNDSEIAKELLRNQWKAGQRVLLFMDEEGPRVWSQKWGPGLVSYIKAYMCP